MMDIKIPFKRSITTTGHSLAVSIPKEIAEHLDIKKGSDMEMIVDKNKKEQLYIALYKKEAEDGTNEN